MQADRHELYRYYESLTDEALRAVNPDDLTEEARECFEEEFAERGLGGTPAAAVDEPAWMEDATCAFSYNSHPGQETAGQAADAMEALRKAGIPCYLTPFRVEPSPYTVPQPFYEYRVMVPTAKVLEAESVIESELTNRDIEEKWRVHFATLGDEDLRAFDIESLFRGLLERIDHVKQAYAEEVQRREEESGQAHHV